MASIFVRLGLRDHEFRSGLDRARGHSRRFASSMKGIMTAAFGGVSAGAFAAGAKNAMEWADTLANTSRTIGTTTTFLQEMQYAARANNIEIAQTNMALQRFFRRTGQAKEGRGELVKVFEALGINLRDVNGEFFTGEQILEKYADAVSKISDEERRLLMWFKAFDSEGAAFGRVLENGAAGLRELRKEAQMSGQIVDEKKIGRLSEANTELANLQHQFVSGMGQLVGMGLDLQDTVIGTLGALAAGGNERERGVEAETEAVRRLRKEREKVVELAARAPARNVDVFFAQMEGIDQEIAAIKARRVELERLREARRKAGSPEKLEEERGAIDLENAELKKQAAAIEEQMTSFITLRAGDLKSIGGGGHGGGLVKRVDEKQLEELKKVNAKLEDNNRKLAELAVGGGGRTRFE